jgi:hypothetical protein
MQHLLGAFLRAHEKRVRLFCGSARLPPLQNPSPKKAMPDLVLKRLRIVLNEVYDVVSEGRVVGRIFLSAGPAPSWLWILAYRFHEGRSPTRGQEATIDAAMQAFAKTWHREWTVSWSRLFSDNTASFEMRSFESSRPKRTVCL